MGYASFRHRRRDHFSVFRYAARSACWFLLVMPAKNILVPGTMRPGAGRPSDQIGFGPGDVGGLQRRGIGIAGAGGRLAAHNTEQVGTQRIAAVLIDRCGRRRSAYRRSVPLTGSPAASAAKVPLASSASATNRFPKHRKRLLLVPRALPYPILLVKTADFVWERYQALTSSTWTTSVRATSKVAAQIPR